MREAANVAAPDSSVGSNRSPVHIVPKGLRSFDAHDADFFLELVPGPRDRQGLPDSIRFWKTRIEETDSDNTFAVGLIYGPSGCGKSSLIKAGLLPRLAEHVNVVYVEATAEETESRLLAGLRKRCGDVPPGLGLKETLSALRRGDGAVSDGKVLIVLDQFEQWLHARKDDDGAELVQAFRQCDGGRVQCLIMVRDDFWLAVSRLFQEMEVRIVEGQNSALVDLFDRDHACHVLTALGKAFGKIPECGSQMTKEQREFVNQAVVGLSREGRVVCVRLALFAEMMKNKAWLPATLREMGGIEGVGLTFLEETFSAATAPPEHRRHQQAARAVLRLLLPDSAADLKGQMRSCAELLAAAGYAGRGHDFDELLRILDSEVRLITPTDPEGKEHAAAAAAESGAKFYQLTHDYLVHSLRDWLTRKQKETRRGRAELLLVDRATVWNGRPENRQLPSLFQWLQIERLVARSSWTPPQRKMMSRARRLHGTRLGIAAALAIAAALVGLGIRSAVVEKHNATHAADLVQGMLDANIAQVPDRINDLEAYRHWADPLLRKAFDAGKPDSAQKLRAALALLPVDAALVEFLYGRLLTARADEVPVICAVLEPHKSALVDPLWTIALSTAKDAAKHRLQAAAALAMYDPESKKWADADKAVCDDFVVVPAVYLSSWIDSLHPVRSKLLPRLEAIYLDPDRPDYERAWTAKILAEFAADNAPMLYKLLLNADEQQFATVFPKLQNVESGESGMRVLTAELSPAVKVDENAKEVDKERLAKRCANVAVALLKMNQPANVWPLLVHREDPRLRSYFIHRIASLHAGANAIVERLDSEKDITVRRALILALGEIGEGEVGEADFPAEQHQALLPKLHDWYVTTDDAGFHAAVEWLLRNWTLNDAQWAQDQWLKQRNENWANDKERSKQEQKAIRAASQPGAGPRWYVNGQGQTMVVVPRPGKFTMGAPRDEVGTEANEQQHPMTIDRTYAVSAKLVTIKQFQQFDPHYLPASAKFAEDADQPAVSVDWYAAARYCDWLSEKEGIPAKQWCYENGGLGPSYSFRLKANYLSLNGYRLPTEAEMEYAMRAGAKTSRFYGETDELLPKYAWFARNSKNQTWPVGRLKPNDFGLFDAQGNAYTWCQEHYPRPDSAVDQEDVLTIDPKAYRSARRLLLRSSLGPAFGEPRLRRADKRPHLYRLPRRADVSLTALQEKAKRRQLRSGAGARRCPCHGQFTTSTDRTRASDRPRALADRAAGRYPDLISDRPAAASGSAEYSRLAAATHRPKASAGRAAGPYPDQLPDQPDQCPDDPAQAAAWAAGNSRPITATHRPKESAGTAACPHGPRRVSAVTRPAATAPYSESAQGWAAEACCLVQSHTCHGLFGASSGSRSAAALRRRRSRRGQPCAWWLGKFPVRSPTTGWPRGEL